MTRLLLIRHAYNDSIGVRIAGWQPGIHLNGRGRREALLLAEGLGRRPIARIVSSPLERAQETAEPLARRLGLTTETSAEFGEVRFGEWTGKRFEELDPLEEWRRWNRERATAHIPGGERMAEVQGRMVAGLDRIAGESAGGVVAVVSHGDPIRSAICHYLGLSLDCILRFEVSPASVSEIELTNGASKVIGINRRL